MPEPLTLSDAEVRDLTGRQQPARQAEACEEMGLVKGIHFFVRPDGKVRIIRARLEGVDKPQPRQARTFKPNFTGPAFSNAKA